MPAGAPTVAVVAAMLTPDGALVAAYQTGVVVMTVLL